MTTPSQPTTAQLAALILAELSRPTLDPDRWIRWSWAAGPGVVQVLATRLGCTALDAHALLRPALDRLVQHGIVEMDGHGFARPTALGCRVMATDTTPATLSAAA